MSGTSNVRAKRHLRTPRSSAILTGIVLLLLPATAQTQLTAPQSVPAFEQMRWVTTDSNRPAWVPPVASALVPGSGQLFNSQHRGVIYVAVEVFLVARFLSLQSEGRHESNQFRELAFTIARSPFTPAIRDTVFEYFEQMEKFIESGPFDMDPGSALVPPTDERTFNGSVWALARETFFANPDSLPSPDSEEYQRALEFYRERAVGPNFQWSWRNAGLEQDLFRQSIRESDEAFRGATRQLGLLLANHLLSALDAFITQRLSRNGRRVEVSSMLGPAGIAHELQGLISLRVAF